ncbi:hypothetical protein B5U98_02605 [Bosea sp. Tri-39]|nr:hypothetical protein B5U98_02605 [Bosea sp. Tri-39]
MRLVGDRGNAGLDRGAVDVEGPAGAVQRIDDVGGTIGPAEAQVGEAIDLREGAGHHDVLAGRDQFEARGIVVAPDVLGIGRVEHEQNMRRQAGLQTLDLVEGQIGAGRVVGVGEEDDLGARRHRGEDRVDIGGEVRLGHDHRLAAGGEDRDLVDEEAVLSEHALVAIAEIDLGDQLQQFVRAGAADDAVGVEAVAAGDRLAQLRRRAVGIEFKLAGKVAIGRDRLGARAERGLVGGELVQLDAGRSRGLAGDIGLDVEDAGTRDGAGGGQSHGAGP